MKKIILILSLITFAFSATGQSIMDFSLDSLMQIAKGMNFKSLKNYDSTFSCSSFNFNKFCPEGSENGKSRYYVYYKGDKIMRIDYFKDSADNDYTYSILVNDFDSLRYFVFRTLNDSGKVEVDNYFGVSIKVMETTIIYALHKPMMSDYDDISQSYQIDWVSPLFFYPVSVFVVDSNLLPKVRLYFNVSLLSYSRCVYNGDVCTEFIHAFVSDEKLWWFKHSFINAINLKQLEKIIFHSQFLYRTFLLQHDFPIKSSIKWDYYKEIIRVKGFRT